MAHEGDTPKGSAIDRSDRPGHIGLVLLLASILVGAILSLRFLGSEQAQPLILGLLAFFAMAGVFFLFAMAIGVIQFAGQTARNDITKLMADTSGDGLVVIEDDGRIVYANEAYLVLRRLAWRRRAAGRAPVHRRAGGLRGDLSARAGRPRTSHRLGGDPPVAVPRRLAGIRLVPGARAARAAPQRPAGGPVDHRRRDPRAGAPGERLPGTPARHRLSRPRAGGLPVHRSQRLDHLSERDARLLARLRSRAGGIRRA